MASNVELELELTYLARELPEEIRGVRPHRLLDIYVPENSERPFIRLRQTDEQYEITKKHPINDEDASRQTEQTIPLEEDEFAALSEASSRTVQKNRYIVVINGHAAEVDVFRDQLEGLVLIDFEFDSLEAMQKFQPPACCLIDVTQERFLAGGQLSGKSYTDIEADLERLKYKKLSL